MNQDELEGKAETLKGKIKKATGDLIDNDRLREEGAAEETAGKVQDTVGKGRRKVGEAIEDLGDQIKK